MYRSDIFNILYFCDRYNLPLKNPKKLWRRHYNSYFMYGFKNIFLIYNALKITRKNSAAFKIHKICKAVFFNKPY